MFRAIRKLIRILVRRHKVTKMGIAQNGVLSQQTTWMTAGLFKGVHGVEMMRSMLILTLFLFALTG
ncbi:MAG: hypothetical protein M2R45_03287 [Verrucomicrobia subdivision 3 bacterium]|nr:hypothetical protein [Limisphaerales bacterium]MCS1415435.1 hypothetical protein [Limisphaerales bacterium]